MKWIRKDILSNTNTHAEIAEIHVGNTKDYLIYDILSIYIAENFTCKQCEDEVNQNAYLTEHKYWKSENILQDENPKTSWGWTGPSSAQAGIRL